MPEKDVALELIINGEEFLATRHNTSLFTFLGELSCYDHVFILKDEETGEGGYLFKNQTVFNDLGAFIVAHSFPMHLNMTEVAECDQDAFNGTFYRDIRSNRSFPPEWGA